MSAEPLKIEEDVRRVVRDTLGVDVRSIEPIRKGLGLRPFFRVRTSSGEPPTLVARVEAPEDPKSRPAGIAPEPAMEPLRTFLAESGLPVPLRFGGDEHCGIDLLEDLGSRSLEAVVANCSEAQRQSFYEEASDLVVRLQRAGEQAVDLPAFTRRLDRTLLNYKADLFAEWSLETALGRPPKASEREVVHDAFELIADEVEAAPQRLAHRDLQSSNLYVRHGRRAGHRLTMIDFQGAFLAPPEYDLVCLLRDSYVELPEVEVSRLLHRVRTRLPDRPDPRSFARRFDLLTLSRKGKDHARFVSAAVLRGERDYLRHIPATVRALQGAARRTASFDPRIERLAEFVDRLPESPCGQ